MSIQANFVAWAATRKVVGMFPSYKAYRYHRGGRGFVRYLRYLFSSGLMIAIFLGPMGWGAFYILISHFLFNKP